MTDITNMLGKIHNGDCLEFMRQLPDKCIDLVLTDPPYGIGIAANPVRQMHEKSDWDNKPPTWEVFSQIFRISRKQIIWGGNYFALPASQGFYIWDKVQPEDFSLAMCEMAWTNMKFPAKIFRYSVLTERDKKHPTQKPEALFRWLLNRHEEEKVIFDPFMGSGTTGVACESLGRKWFGCELEAKYCEIANKRIEAERAQLKLF